MFRNRAAPDGALSPTQVTLVLVPAFVFLIAFTAANAAPRAELWERWTAHDPDASVTIDHSAWDLFVKNYVKPAADGISRLAYAAITTQDRAALEDYLRSLGSVRISEHQRDEQFAFWVNLYNALTVRVILEHYPVASIRNISISPGLFSSGPWGKKLIEVEGETLSLDDIEHRILRPIWRDPRIHYAVNCASLGCPNLMNEAFTARNASALLDRGARAYVNHMRGARVANGRLVVSSIYEWFKADFGGSDRAVIDHLRSYADPQLAQALMAIDHISEDTYDWSLNDLMGG